MHIKTKYFYADDTEMKQGDLVYLCGSEAAYGLEFSGIFKVAHINEEILTVYFLGQDHESYQSIEIDIESISALLPIANYGLTEEVEEIKKEIYDRIKDRG